MNDNYHTGHVGWSPDFKSTPKLPQLGRLIPSDAASGSPSSGLDSDSIVSACNCLTKTNEVKYHRPGCKYRLICERDEAFRLLRVIEEGHRNIKSRLYYQACDTDPCEWCLEVRQLIPENADVPAPAGDKTPNP